MGPTVILLLLALVFGSVGLLVTGLGWALVVAAILVAVGALITWHGRRHRRAGP